MRHLAALWRDEAGVVVSTELIVVGTVVVICTLVGVFLVRLAVMYMFMGVATDFAREQPFAFDTIDTYESHAGGKFQDNNAMGGAKGLVGYSQRRTPADPAFSERFPGLVGAGQGEQPVTIEPTPAQGEGAGL